MIAAALLQISNSCHVGLVKSCLARHESLTTHKCDGVSPVLSAKDYRRYAQQCLRCADETENDGDREIFLEMATAWTQLELTSAPADIATCKTLSKGRSSAALPPVSNAGGAAVPTASPRRL